MGAISMSRLRIVYVVVRVREVVVVEFAIVPAVVVVSSTPVRIEAAVVVIAVVTAVTVVPAVRTAISSVVSVSAVTIGIAIGVAVDAIYVSTVRVVVVDVPAVGVVMVDVATTGIFVVDVFTVRAVFVIDVSAIRAIMEDVAVLVARTILVSKGRGYSRQGEGKSEGHETCKKTNLHRRISPASKTQRAPFSSRRF